MSYTPKNNELVTTQVPDEPNEQPEIAMVIRRATQEDKVRYVERLKTLLVNEEFQQESLRTFFASNSLFLCLYQDELKVVDSANILGPLTEDSPESSIPSTIHV